MTDVQEVDAPATRARTATWVSTTKDAAWVQHEPVVLTPLAITSMQDFPAAMVRSTDVHQEVDGFGACFNEMGWRALSRMSEADRAAFLDLLFTPSTGDGSSLGFTLCRMPLGANDFSLDWYSYDEVDGDLALDHFDVAHDRETLIPFLHEALRRQPDLQVWASPWSPPQWMKTTGHYAAALPFPGTGVETGIREDQVGREGTDMMRLEPEVLEAYARYFAMFVEAYAAEGIEVSAVMPQNEWNSPQVFPSCTWTPAGLAAFIKVLGPLMSELGVEVLLGTLERADPDLVLDVLADEDAARWITGVGFQWAGRGAIHDVRRAAPGLRLWQTEQECGDGRNDWRFARHAWSLMQHFFDEGASGYCYWNMALDAGGVSRWGWPQNSLVVVDPETGEGRLTHELYVLRHVAGFVTPGSRRLAPFSWTGHHDQLAFRRPDGSVVVAVQNPLAEPMPYTIAVDAEVVDVVLPADSFSTFVLPAAG